MGEQRRRITGNLVGARVDQVMNAMGWGARSQVLARIHLLAGHDQRFAELAGMEASTLSRIRGGGQAITDVELMALAVALRRNPTWLAGMSEEAALTDPDLLRLVDDV